MADIVDIYRSLVDVTLRHGRDGLQAALDDFTPFELGVIADLLEEMAVDALTAAPRYADLVLLPHQQPPDGPWTYWTLAGGRGAGKTSGASAFVYDHVMNDDPCIPGVPGGHRVTMIAPTLGDASRAINAPGGIKSLDPDCREVTRKGGTYVEFPGGSLLSEFGAHGKDDIERLRAAGNSCLAWCEELVAWRQLGYENDAWDLMRTGLRLGRHPRVVVSTTPKPIPKLRELFDLAQDPDEGRYVLTHGSTFDNPHLADTFVAEMRDLYEGTRLEAQELMGILLGEVLGALWTEVLLRDTRVAPDAVPTLRRKVVGVDPAFSEEEGSDEVGIIVAGVGRQPSTRRQDAYVVEDLSGRHGGHKWPQIAVEAYHRHDAYAIVAEANLGGRDFLRKTIHAIDPSVKVDTVHATQGKRTRAEPIALLYDRQRAHHVGTFALLEAEQTSWVPGDRSPNRLDALVWALDYLSGEVNLKGASTSVPRGALPRGRPTPRTSLPGRRTR